MSAVTKKAFGGRGGMVSRKCLKCVESLKCVGSSVARGLMK